MFSAEISLKFIQNQLKNSPSSQIWNHFGQLIEKRMWYELSTEIMKSHLDQVFLAKHDLFEVFEQLVYPLKQRLDLMAVLQVLFKLTFQFDDKPSTLDKFVAIFERIGAEIEESEAKEAKEPSKPADINSLAAKKENNVAHSTISDEMLYFTLCKLQIMLYASTKMGRELDLNQLKQMLASIRLRMNDNRKPLSQSLKLKTYLVLSKYYEHIQDYEKYYMACLTFLHLLQSRMQAIMAKSNLHVPQMVSSGLSIQEETEKLYFESEQHNLSDAELHDICKNTCFSALVSKNLFTFGELLRHPVAQYLHSTPDQWIIQMIEAFNNGNIDKFNQLLQANTPATSQHPLKLHWEILEQKIRMMSLLNLAYETGFKHLTFEQIAQHTKVGMQDVELLVIRCIASKLIAATINQTSHLVTIHSVKPRVLTTEQMSKLSMYLVTWAHNVEVQQAKSLAGLHDHNSSSMAIL